MKNTQLYKLLFSTFIIWSSISNAQKTITHNCGPIIKTTDHSCTSGDIYWAKDFILNQFGITTQDEFIINKGQVALSYTTWKPNVQFNIYEIDNNFPNSFSSANLIGSSQVDPLPIIGYNQGVQVITVNFNTPIIIPQNIERILVEVKKGVEYGGALAHIAGSTQDNGISWYRNCIAGNQYINTDTILNNQWPGTNYNFYINIQGIINNTTTPFTLNYTNDCNDPNKHFFLSNSSNITSISWDFDDPISGGNNTSNLISPTHNFTSPGQYQIEAIISHVNGSTSVINEVITIAQNPIAHPINDIYTCENTLNSGISDNFNTSNIEAQVLNGQTGLVVSYYDQNGNQLPSPLPNPFTNTQANSQTITVRVSDSNNLCCYNETAFNLISNPLPEPNTIGDIYACDNDNDGFTIFDLDNIYNLLINGQANLDIDFFDSNTNVITTTNFQNLIANQDHITAIITNLNTNCYSEININILTHDNPIANTLPILYGCDDNNDGISEYFDTVSLENQVLNGQNGMAVSYFDQSGNQLPNPLPNPFTNSTLFNELINVRVTDINTGCYSETIAQFQTLTKPNIYQPNNLYACDQGDGFAIFDTSTIETQILGNQTGLSIQYYDSNYNQLPSPLPTSFLNTEPYSQTINIKVEDVSNPLCYTEKSFDLIINTLPEIDLENEYSICDLEPFLELSLNSNFNSYQWEFEDGTIISSSNSAEVINEGNYTVTVNEATNNITCNNSFSFNLKRLELPNIQHINFGEFGNNFIEIIATGDGVLEYSIDGVYFQDNNFFSNLEGGNYTVFARDKNGCGIDSKEVSIIDYPKFFTPNNDGINDYWQIKGIKNFPKAKILIFDRFGKTLTQLSAKNKGWDGTFNGRKMFSNDYWFKIIINDKKSFTGHFSLKR